MKIAMPVDAPNLDARVENRLGTASYLLVVDTETGTFEAVQGPSGTSGPGAGIQIVSMAVGMGADTVLCGYVAPYIAETLEKAGVRIITEVQGSAREAVQAFQRGDFHRDEKAGEEGEDSSLLRPQLWQGALQRAARQFVGMLPILIGVILLVGLFQAFLPRQALTAVFSKDPFWDTLWGACAGSLLAGNPVNSYVIGQTLLDMGVGWCGVTALMLSWVGVGLVQLPAEIKALGMRFAVIRSGTAFAVILLAVPLIVALSGRAW